MQYIGIDIAKSSFVVAFPKGQGYTTSTYKNDQYGIKTFLGELDKSLHHCVLEATGNYGALLVEMLLEADLSVSVINPKQIKHFSKVMLSVTKTDKMLNLFRCMDQRWSLNPIKCLQQIYKP